MGRGKRSATCIFFIVCSCIGNLPAQELTTRSSTRESDAKVRVLSEPPTNALDRTQLEFYLRHVHVWPPHFSVNIGDYRTSQIPGLLETEVKVSFQLASQVKTILVSENGQHIIDAAPYQISDNPFRVNLDKINMLDLPGFGTEGAPVAIVVYSDFQCPHCAREAHMLRTQLVEEYPHDVRVYYRDFPLSKHKWARMAALAGQCLHDFDSDIYWEYFDWVFSTQKNLDIGNFAEKLNIFLDKKTVDTLQIAQCIASDKFAQQIQESIQEGSRLGVRSTPTMFINGRKVRAVKWARLKQIVDAELAYQEVVHNAGDDCGCSISPEIPGFE